jgi:hypothetical protein
MRGATFKRRLSLLSPHAALLRMRCTTARHGSDFADHATETTGTMRCHMTLAEQITNNGTETANSIMTPV